MLMKKALELKPPVKKHIIIPFILLLLFVVFYPIGVAIYVLPPLFIGTMAYVLIEGLAKEKYIAIFVAFVYFTNLEVNLSLPLFFIVILSLLFYVVFYPTLKEIKRCKYCKAIVTVLAINLMYAFGLYFYDFIFGTKSIVFDSMLMYSLLVDVIVVVLL